MPGLSRLVFALVMIATVVVGLPRTALAQAGKQSMHIVAIDSDDADEQADALTAALRSRIRETPGWSLLDTTQSLSMLTASLRCPTRPDVGCLVRIGDKLQANQFIWGVMSKAPSHQVSVEVHLWTRGKPDQVAKDTFSDNLKEPSDDALRKVAGGIISKLLGITSAVPVAPVGAPGGVLTIHVNSDVGSVLVDGEQKATLDHGRASVTVPPGAHSLTIQAAGFVDAHRDVTVLPGANVPLEIQLEAAAPTSAGKPFPWHKVGGWGAIGVGGVLVIVGAIEGGQFLSDQSALNTDRAKNYGVGPPTIQNPCQVMSGAGQGEATVTKGCNDLNAAKSAEVGEIVTFALGGALVATGVVLLLTDHPDKDAAPADSAPKTGLSSVRFLPAVGVGSGSFTIMGRF